MERHPAADSLSVARIFGYDCVVRTEDWLGITKAAYLPPDSVVDVSRPEFSFLAPQAKSGKARVKAKKLRGIVSFGCLIPQPDDAVIGTDLAEHLGVEHYEPPIKGEGGVAGGGWLSGHEDDGGPSAVAPKYDLEALRRYRGIFEPGEPCLVSEKLDGCNGRYVFDDDRMHCGSRTSWKKEFADCSHITIDYLVEKGCPPEKAEEVVAKLRDKPARRNLWWDVLRRTPALEAFCRANPGVVVYGEVVGTTNCIKYRADNQFAAFDLLRDGSWVDPLDAFGLLRSAGVPTVPFVHPEKDEAGWCSTPELPVRPIPYDFETICDLAEGKSLWGMATNDVIREGVVVSPLRERIDPRVGRVKMKVVSGAFLEKYR